MFKLRKGLTFHNGKTVTATMLSKPTTIIAARIRSRRSRSASSIVKDIKADGPETVVFTLNSGSADFPYITSDYHLPIYPAKDGGGIEWEKGVSAGPYMLESYRAGREGALPSATPTITCPTPPGSTTSSCCRSSM